MVGIKINNKNMRQSSVLASVKELKRVYLTFIWMDDYSPLLQYERPVCHTRGIYGFNFAVYNVPNDRWENIALCCGDRSTGIKTIHNWEIEKKYTDKVKEYLEQNKELSDEDKKSFVRENLVQMVTEIYQNQHKGI